MTCSPSSTEPPDTGAPGAQHDHRIDVDSEGICRPSRRSSWSNSSRSCVRLT
jgi:hypothetical protein